MKTIEGLAHCQHHDIHWEFCFDYEKRVKFIKACKPLGEQALRLKLFQIVPDELIPGKDSSEWQAYEKARQVYVQADQATEEAWKAFKKADQAYEKACQASEKTCQVYKKAWKASEEARQAWKAYLEAWKAYEKAWKAYLDKYGVEFEELHDKLFPDCPWNGQTIFASRILEVTR